MKRICNSVTGLLQGRYVARYIFVPTRPDPTRTYIGHLGLSCFRGEASSSSRCSYVTPALPLDMMMRGIS